MQINYYVVKFHGEIAMVNCANRKSQVVVYKEEYPKYRKPALWRAEKVSCAEIIDFAKRNNCDISLYLILSGCNKDKPENTSLSFRYSTINLEEFVSQQIKSHKELFKSKVKRCLKLKV